MAARVSGGHAGDIYDGYGRLRAVHGYDGSSGMLSELMARFADISKKLLNCDWVYVYQFRVNVKNGTKDGKSKSGAWKPHRNFDYWQKWDGMRERRAGIVMLVNERHAKNGPLEVCPGTHKSELGDGELIVGTCTYNLNM